MATSQRQTLTAEQKITYFTLVQQGVGFAKAAKSAGIGPAVLKRYRRDDPDFREMEEASESVVVSRIESKLLEAADNGEPWAIKMFLERRAPERWAATTTATVKHEVSGTIELTAAKAEEQIAAITARLIERRDSALAELPAAADDIVDAEVIE